MAAICLSVIAENTPAMATMTWLFSCAQLAATGLLEELGIGVDERIAGKDAESVARARRDVAVVVDGDDDQRARVGRSVRRIGFEAAGEAFNAAR